MVIASFALWTGYRKHGKTLPLVFAGLAISFLLLAGVAGQHGLFSGIGGLLFAIAHVLNWRLAH